VKGFRDIESSKNQKVVLRIYQSLCPSLLRMMKIEVYRLDAELLIMSANILFSNSGRKSGLFKFRFFVCLYMDNRYKKFKRNT
jgi:hypothetical protein